MRAVPQGSRGCGVTTQIRIFSITSGALDTLHAAWRAGVYPLRLQHSFRIDGAWTVPEEHRFIWLLSYDGPEPFEEQDAASYASTARVTLDPDPRQYIEHVEAYFLTPALDP